MAQFAVANDGTLVYAPGRASTMTTPVWVNRQGHTRPVGLPEATYSSFDLSPDGGRLVFGLEAPDGRVTQLWLYDIQRQRKSPLTGRVTSGEETWNAYPRWTPDGRGVVYFRIPAAGRFQIALQRVDEGGEPSGLWSNTPPQPGYLTPVSFTPDARAMLAFGPINPGSIDIVRFGIDARSGLWTRGPESVLATSYSEYFGQVSPDGRWMLFTSDRSGRDEIYVTSYPVPGVMHKVSRDGGHKAVWIGASEIVYKFGAEMHAVAVTLGPEFRAGEPRLLFAGDFPNIPGLDFAVAPGGREFLMLENPDILRPTTTLTVITNVVDDLDRRAPSTR